MPNQSAQPIVFGKYTLLERISHGGMAEVFRAMTTGEAGFERIVAIKLLLPQVAMDEEFVTMLIDEAKIAGQLSHANIAQIFDLGKAEDRYYIVQEYVPGRDLRAILRHVSERKERLGLAQACHMLLKVCEGLDYAHNKRDAAGNPLNLVHRDISPQNVIASYEGEIKLIDFGIVKAEGRATRTLAGLVKGKFAYMSPEQLRGLPVDRRSDVFACGIVLHELLTGQPLFKRATEFETLRRARYSEIEPPSQANSEVPPELDRITLKALARHVDDRYQSALEFRDELWDFVRSAGCFYSRNELAAWMRQTFPESPADDEPGMTEPDAPLPAAVKRLADLRARPIAPPPLDYDDSDPHSDLPQDGDGYGEMMTVVDPGYQDRFDDQGGPESEDPGRPTKPMGSTTPAVRDLANAALSQPDRAVFIPGQSDARLAVGSDPVIDLGVPLPRRSPTEDEETTSQRADIPQTEPLGAARWIEPQTPTQRRPSAAESAPDPGESSTTTPYLPAVRGASSTGGAAPAASSSDPIREALANAKTLGPHSARLPGLPPAHTPSDHPGGSGEQGGWRPGGAAPDPSSMRGAGNLPSPAPAPRPGPSMSPGPGPSMSPVPGPSMSPRPGPSMSPVPGPGMPSPLPGPYPYHPQAAQAARGTSVPTSRKNAILIGGAVLVLVAAAIASIILAASGG